MSHPSFLAIISRIFEPLSGLLQEAIKTEAERDLATAKLAKLQADAVMSALQFEEQRLAVSARLVAAEAGGQSWLQRSWRPITMICFLGLVLADSFGLLAFRLSAEAWHLLQIGLGGYVVGRSVEKIMPQISTKTHAGRI